MWHTLENQKIITIGDRGQIWPHNESRNDTPAPPANYSFARPSACHVSIGRTSPTVNADNKCASFSPLFRFFFLSVIYFSSPPPFFLSFFFFSSSSEDRWDHLMRKVSSNFRSRGFFESSVIDPRLSFRGSTFLIILRPSDRLSFKYIV